MNLKKISIILVVIIVFIIILFYIRGKIGNKEYELSEQKYSTETDVNKDILYPQLSNLEDSDTQNRVNELIYELVLSMLEPEVVQQNITYEIARQDKNIISIIFRAKNIGTSRPYNFSRAITIDLKESKKLYLYDIIEKNWLEENFINNNFVQTEGIDEVEEIGRDNLLQAYYDGFNFEDNLHGSDFFLRDDKFGLIIGVGDTGGGYAIFEAEWK